MIFGSQYPHVDITQRYQSGSLVDVIHRGAVKLPQTPVQVHDDALGRGTGKCIHSHRVLFRPNTQVDVSIGS